MKNKNLIPLKAMFLLFVFSMSTMLSFACAIGVKMGYNENHHAPKEIVTKTTHASYAHEKEHHHPKEAQHQHHKAATGNEKSTDDDCCKKEARKFGKIDKIVSKVSVDIQQPVFIISFFKSFNTVNLLESTELISVKRNLYRSHHPPIPDRQLATQSFLI